MAARIHRLARTQRVPDPAPASPGLAVGIPSRIHSWRGASGQHHLHTVYSLIECPPLPKATYLLVRRNDDASRTVLHIGCGQSDASTLNLAQVRQRGAQLGANEVHVNFLVAGEDERRLLTCDLRAGQFGSLGSERAAAASA